MATSVSTIGNSSQQIALPGGTGTQSFGDTMGDWASTLAQSAQYLAAQRQIDAQSQAIAFQSAVEAKSNSLIMGIIQNIR